MPLLRIVNWKGESTQSAVPTYTRTTEVPNQENGPQFKARPIKHWRKQLIPNAPRGVSVSNQMCMDKPGGTVYLGVRGADCFARNQLGLTGPEVVQEDILKPSLGATTDYCISPACKGPIIRRAKTLLKSNYYSDTKGYLRSRCVTYDQKLSSNRAPNVQYVGANGEALNPTDAPNGPQVRLTQSCASKCQGNQAQGSQLRVETIHKPNNRQFYTQGGVDSSARIERLKLNTLNKTAGPAQPKNTPNAKLPRFAA